MNAIERLFEGKGALDPLALLYVEARIDQGFECGRQPEVEIFEWPEIVIDLVGYEFCQVLEDRAE